MRTSRWRACRTPCFPSGSATRSCAAGWPRYASCSATCAAARGSSCAPSAAERRSGLERLGGLQPRRLERLALRGGGVELALEGVEAHVVVPAGRHLVVQGRRAALEPLERALDPLQLLARRAEHRPGGGLPPPGAGSRRRGGVRGGGASLLEVLLDAAGQMAQAAVGRQRVHVVAHSLHEEAVVAD